MNKNLKAIKETLLKWGLKGKDASAVSGIIETMLAKQAELDKVNFLAIRSALITKPKYMIKLGDKTFMVPVKTGLAELGLGEDFRFNNAGILLYSGKKTLNYIEQIANNLKLDPAKIVLPTKDETEKMHNDEVFRKALRDAGIDWVPFIIDNEDESRNVSLKEYWNDPDKYRFCGRNIFDGLWNCFDPVIFNYSLDGAVLLGGLK